MIHCNYHHWSGWHMFRPSFSNLKGRRREERRGEKRWERRTVLEEWKERRGRKGKEREKEDEGGKAKQRVVNYHTCHRVCQRNLFRRACYYVIVTDCSFSILSSLFYCMSVCLSVCLSVWLLVCSWVCLSVFLFFLHQMFAKMMAHTSCLYIRDLSER